MIYDVRIIISIVLALVYLVILLLINRYIRQKIKDKKSRKEYKKDNRINEKMRNIFAPAFVVIGVFFVLFKDDVSTSMKVAKIILFLSYIPLSILQLMSLKRELKKIDNR